MFLTIMKEQKKQNINQNTDSSKYIRRVPDPWQDSIDIAASANTIDECIYIIYL